MTKNVRSFLIEQNLLEPHAIPSASGEFRISCPQCHNDKQKCYVNGEGRGLNCKHCGYSRGWRSFVRQFEPPTPQEKALEDFTSIAEEYLWANKDILQYLTDRGLSEQTIKASRLGYWPENAAIYDDPVDHELGLFNNGWFLKNRIIIPYTRDGIVETVRGRTAPGSNDDKKYLGLPGAHTGLYYPSETDYKNPVFITEGEFDSLILAQLGYQAVASPGANQQQVVKSLGTYTRIYSCFDGDEAGRKGAKALRGQLPEIYEIDLPDNMDVTDYIAAFGEDSFNHLISNAKYYVNGKEQKDDRLDLAIESWEDWAWSNGELLGPKMLWAPRLEKALSGWSRGLFLVGALPNSGKSCTAKGTPIRMYDGTIKPCEEIRVGDTLMGPDSSPRTVLDTCSGTAQLHKVEEKDGSFYEVTGPHLLCVQNKDANKGKSFTISPEELYTKPHLQSRLMGYRTSIEYPKQMAWADPYMLGVWLGDGTLRDGDITTADPEIVDSIHSYAKKMKLSVGLKVKIGNKATTYAFTYRQGMPNQWRKYLDFYSLRDGKHIPDAYLINDRKTRLELLAGLVDTDGSLSTSGTYDIVQKNFRLSQDIQKLARSLGFYCSVTPCTKTCTNNGAVGQYYRIYISGEVSQIPVRIKRKKAHTDQKRNPLTNKITVIPSRVGEYYGFTVDGDNLFLLGDYTVTHNCFFVKSAYEAAKDNSEDTICVYLTLDDDQEDALSRLVSLHTGVSFELIRSPRFSFDHPTDLTRKDPEMLKAFQASLSRLKEVQNLVFRDAKYGRSLEYIRRYLASLRKRYFDKRIVVFIDSLAKVTAEDEPMSTPINNWKAYLATELKYLSTLHDICIVTPADFRKLNDERRPTNDDLKDASELAYEANGVLLGFNELNVKGDADRVILKWQPDGHLEWYPMFELNVTKNKKSLYKGNIRFKFYPPTSQFEELDERTDYEFDKRIKEAALNGRRGSYTTNTGITYAAEPFQTEPNPIFKPEYQPAFRFNNS